MIKRIFSILFIMSTLALFAQQPEKRYEVKSGTMSLTSEIFGKEQEMLMYFDDYGAMEYSQTNGEIMGFKVNNVQIKKDGYLYNIDVTNKTGKKTKIEENTPQYINFTNITQKLIDEMHVEKKGTEEFLGRVCDRWEINHTDMRMIGYFLVWKGISLKTDMQISGMIVRMKVKSIDLESSLPAHIFDIPDDIKIIEQ